MAKNKNLHFKETRRNKVYEEIVLRAKILLKCLRESAKIENPKKVMTWHTFASPGKTKSEGSCLESDKKVAWVLGQIVS